MSAAAVGAGAELVFGPVVGLIRAGYSLVQYGKHSFRSYEDYNDWSLTDKDANVAFATPADVRKGYWTQFLRGLSELCLPIISAVGWLFNDHREEIRPEQVSSKEGTAWYKRVGQMMEGPQMRKLAFAEDLINDIIEQRTPKVLK